jgi:hypothetical protein
MEGIAALQWHPSVTRAFALSPSQKERGVIERPDIASYSVPARICLGIAVFGALLFAVMAGIYFMH